MKTLSVFILAFFIVSSCSKDSDPNEKHCYECDVDNDNNYNDAGCLTNEQWNKVILTDESGTDLPDSEQIKRTRCRRK